MKKIILAFDGNHYSSGAFEFARRLNELQSILLVGIFLPPAQLATLWSFADAAGGPLIPLLNTETAEPTEKNVHRFERDCIQNNIDFRIHKDLFDFALPELKKESRFADLLILGSELFYDQHYNGLPNDYLKDALHDMACPVLLVPEKFEFPENIILAYDGTEDALFAIKQFAYLFPELCGMEVALVYATDQPNDAIPDQVALEELAARHFSNLNLMKLDLDHTKFFSTLISEKKASLLVSGSYGRSGISQLFKKSFVREVIAQHRLPVFIAHK